MRCKMKAIFFAISIISCIFLMTACRGEVKPYTSMHGQIITRLDTRNNKVRIDGLVPSTLVLAKDYEYRIEDNAIYIKIMLTSHKDGKYKTIDFETDLPNNIEKIYIEDDNSKIMIWEISQGYAEFDMQEIWESELQKLTKR